MRPSGGTVTVPRRGGSAAANARLFAVVALAYAAGAVMSWESFGSTIGPAFFPAAGVTVAAMLLTDRRRWPVIVAAIIVAELGVDLRYGSELADAVGFTTANAVEPLIGASLVSAWCGGPPNLGRRKDLFAYLAGACVIAPLVAGTIGGWVSARDGGPPWGVDLLHWAAGDGIGVLVVATPVLLWPKQIGVLRARPLETLAVMAASVGVSVVAFTYQAPPGMLLLPLLAWAAFRLDMLGASLAGAIVAFTANVLTRQGRGLFLGTDLTTGAQLALTQSFIAVIVVVALLIGQESAGRSAAVQDRESERRERLRLEAISGLAAQLSAALTPPEIGAAVAEQVINEAGARSVNLGVLSPDGTTLVWAAMAGYPATVLEEFAGGVDMGERTVSTDAVRLGGPVIIHTAAEYAERYPEKAHWVRMSGSQSVIGWPLADGGHQIGVLLLAWSDIQPLDTAQLAYVSAVATMVGQALVRARAYADEHARAGVLQAAVLPSSPEKAAGMEVCVEYEPADLTEGLGGDWYDVMPLPKGSTYLAVGDVVGHGLQAVEDMAQLRSAGRALAHQGLPPARLLAELNGFTRDASQGKFATMAVAVFDPDAATLSYAVAGHPPPLLRRADTGAVMRLSDAHGPVLGPLRDARYTEGRLAVRSGDMLVLYTDGLVEGRGTDIAAGIAAAERLVAQWAPASALSDCCQSIQHALAPKPRRDDVCVVAIRFS